MAKSKTKKAPPVDPSEFGDLGDVQAAPDTSKPAAKKSPAKASPKKVEAPKPPPEIIISPKDVLKAVNAGDTSGLPVGPEGAEAVLRGKEVVLISNDTKVTAGLLGHAVDCTLVSEVRLVDWHVRGSADQLTGKYRLSNDVRMAVGGKVVMLKAGKEFFDHQISVEDVRLAGGVVLPLGTH